MTLVRSFDCLLPHHTVYPVAILLYRRSSYRTLTDDGTNIFLNVANNGSIENVDAVDALLQANAAFLERITRAS
jgi:hypothetical protein